jgi:hypothetical protein
MYLKKYNPETDDWDIFRTGTPEQIINEHKKSNAETKSGIIGGADPQSAIDLYVRGTDPEGKRFESVPPQMVRQIKDRYPRNFEAIKQNWDRMGITYQEPEKTIWERIRGK